MKLTWLIPVSLLANVFLASALIKHRAPPTLATAEATAAIGAAASITSSTDVAVTPAARDEDSSPRWKNFQTRDVAEMIRRLRQVGCPEDIIRDLVVAEVNREYSTRMRAIPNSGLDNPYWKSMSYSSNSKEWREASKMRRDLQKEKSQRLVDLLGIDPEKESRKAQGLPDSTAYSYMASRVEFLPESKRDAVLGYLEQFEEKMQDFYRETRGLWDSEARAQQRQIEAERLQGLAQFLSPDEVREYELRNSQLANQLTYDLRNLSLSREQYEAIYDLRKKYGESIMNYAETMENPTGRAQVEQNKQAFKNDLTQVLGEDFGKQYERSQDYSYQQLVRLAKRNELPADTAANIYDLKAEIENVAKGLKSSNTQTSDERQAALQELRAKTEQQLKATLGDAVYEKYLNDGGYWIRNLSLGTPKPKPK